MDEIARESAADSHSIVALLSRVVDEGKQVARAEIELQTARIAAKVGEARNAVVLLLVALVMGSSAMTALVVGALLILTPRLGPIGATATVVGALSGVAALFGWLALRHFKLMVAPSEEKP